MGPSQKLLPPPPPLSDQPFLEGNFVFNTSGDCFHLGGSGDCQLQYSCCVGKAAGVFPSVEVLIVAVPADSAGIGAAVGVQDRGFVFEVRRREEGLD